MPIDPHAECWKTNNHAWSEYGEWVLVWTKPDGTEVYTRTKRCSSCGTNGSDMKERKPQPKKD